MIDLGRAALHAEGVTLFFDHAEPTRFHYLPDAPRLRRRADGSPELSLLEYRLDPALHEALGAGLLSLTVELAVEDDVLERLRERVARTLDLPGRPELAPVVVDGGRCEIVVIDKTSAAPAPDAKPDSGLVERILGASSPSLYGTNAATFMVVLSPEGVALVEGALRGGGLPVGVVYGLDVVGIRPALRATITARWEDIYRYYEDRLHGGKLLAAVDVGETISDLVRREAITIHVDELVPADQRDAALDRALAEAQTYVVERFFKPTLGDAPPPEDHDASVIATVGRAVADLAGLFRITYSLRDVDRSELKTFTFDLDAAGAEKRTFAPQGTLTALLDPRGGELPEGVITTVDPAAASQMNFDVGALIDFNAEGIDHLEVDLTYGDANQRVLLDAASPRKTVSFWYDPALGFAVRRRYEAHFRASDEGPAAVLRSDEVAVEGRVIRLNPRELYQRAALRAVAVGVPFDRFPLVLIDLRADDSMSGWSTDTTLQLDPTHGSASWAVRLARGGSLRLRRRLRYADPRGVETVIDWETVEPGVMVVSDPQPEILDVQIVGSARFDTEVKRILVELRLTSQPERVVTRVLTREQPFATWSAPLADPADRAYEYRVTLHTLQSEVREGQWLPGAGPTLIVGERFAQLRKVELLFVGRSFKDLGLIGVRVRFAFEDADAGLRAEDELWVQDTSAPVRWSYPIADPARKAFSYQLTLVHTDGRMETPPPVTTSDLLVVHPLI